MAKISSFIIGMLFIMLAVAGFGLFMATGASKYTSVSYDNSSVQAYDHLANLTQDAETLRNKTASIGQEDGALDVIGSYFTSAYQSVAFTSSSFNTFLLVSDATFENTKLGPFGTIIRDHLVTAVIIFFFFIILSIVLKRDS